MSRLRIAVVFGGMSSEHEVSLLSTASVLKNLSAEKYEIYPMGITKSGRWFFYPGSFDLIPTGEWELHPGCVPAVISPDSSVGGIVMMPQEGRCHIRKLDAVFPVLHGRFGEDGTIQGLFSLAGIPFVGADTLSSAVCMDKEVANSLLDNAGIIRTPWDVIYSENIDQPDSFLDRWEELFGYPMFIKPANSGSSVGVSKAANRESLKEAVKLAFRYDSKVLVEKAVFGKELECAVLGNEDPVASVVSEIAPVNEFYDYDAKYNTPSETFLPARIDSELSKKIQETSVKAYKLLGCSGMARVDFLFDEAASILYLNELNTIPGFTDISMYPKMTAASGIPYPRLLDRLIDLAIDKAASAKKGV